MVKTKDLYIFSLLSYRRVYTPTGILLKSVTNEAPAYLCMPLYTMYISSLKNKMEQAMTLWYQMETNKTYLLTATIAVPLTTATALHTSYPTYLAKGLVHLSGLGVDTLCIHIHYSCPGVCVWGGEYLNIPYIPKHIPTVEKLCDHVVHP